MSHPVTADARTGVGMSGAVDVFRARSMSRISQQQAPQSVPAPQARATADTLPAPAKMAFFTSLSEMRLQTQTIIGWLP